MVNHALLCCIGKVKGAAAVSLFVRSRYVPLSDINAVSIAEHKHTAPPKEPHGGV